MHYLNTIDYTCIVIYVLCLLSLGLYLRKIAAASIEDYFLGGRRLPWWALGVSGMASFLDITGTMVITSFLYMIGPRGLYIAFRGGAVLVLVFMLLWGGKWHRRSGCITRAEWMTYRFGTGPGGHFARLVTAFAQAVFCVGMLIYMIKGVGLFLSTYLPFSPFNCAVGLIVIATIYTMVSGFYGVVFTDIFQSAIILVAVIVVSVTAFVSITGYEGDFADLAAQVTGNLRWDSAVPHQNVQMLKGYEDYTPLLYFAFFYLFRNVLGGLGEGGDPKYFGARSDRECGLLTFLWTWLMMFRWPMMMGFAVLGIFLVHDAFPDQHVLKEAETAIKQTYVAQEAPDLPVDFTREGEVESVVRKAYWSSQGKSLLEDPARNPELTARLQSVLGDQWQGRFAELIEQNRKVEKILPKTKWDSFVSEVQNAPEKYAALVSRLRDPEVLGEDWKDKLELLSYEGGVNPEKILPTVLLAKIPRGLRGLLLIALIAASMSTFDSTVNATTGFFTRDIYQGYVRPRASNRELIFASYLFGVILVATSLLLAQTVKNITDVWDWIIMGLTVGILVPNFMRLYWWRFNAGGLVASTVVGMIAAILIRTLATMDMLHLTAVQQFVILMPVSLLAGVVGTYLSPPTDPAVLEHFYRTTRPFGLWGALKRKLDPEMQLLTTREHFYDILAVPFTMGWQICLFMLPMLLIILAWKAFFVFLAIFAVCLVGMYLFWYRQLPPKDTPNYDDFFRKKQRSEKIG